MNIPFICLLEQPSNTLSLSENNSGNSSSVRLTMMGTEEVAVRPTVTALTTFLTSIPSDKFVSHMNMSNNSSSNNDNSSNSNNTVNMKNGKNNEKNNSVFALFTDDTHHPLQLSQRASLVSLLPQLPIFCLDSDSIVPPTVAYECPSLYQTDVTLSTSHSNSHSAVSEYEILFNEWSERLSAQDWKFGSRVRALQSESSALQETVRTDGTVRAGSDIISTVQRSTASKDAIDNNSSNSNSDISQLINSVNGVNWSIIRHVLSTHVVDDILKTRFSHTDSADSTDSIADRCETVIAGFMGGTLSPRQILTDIMSQDNVNGSVSGNVNHQSDSKNISNDSGKYDDSSLYLSDIRSYLLDADITRYSCYKAIKTGLLCVSCVNVYNNTPVPMSAPLLTSISTTTLSMTSTTIATANTTANETINGSTNRNTNGNNDREEGGRDKYSPGGYSPAISNGGILNSLIPSSCMKWVVPWLQLLSSNAISSLKKPNKMEVTK